MRILITGAGGLLGKKLVNKFLQITAEGEDFLLAIDKIGIEPLFDDTLSKKWISKNLDEMEEDEWREIIETHRIERIYYLECIENLNLFIPNSIETLNSIQQADSRFINYLQSIFAAPETPKLEVCFISTDKVYQKDEFPNELHPLYIDLNQNYLEDENEDNLTKSYIMSKINIELQLLNINFIEPRIIRPFALCDPENGSDWPLTQVILKAMSDVDLEIYAKGDQGLAFTHTQDLINFLMSPNLFDPVVKLKLTTPIINFSRVWNYLSEYLLFRKIRDKLDSKSSLAPLTSINYFENIMKTPQIRNMTKIFLPKITIEEIIEEIAYARNPQNTYEPLIVQQIYYTEGPLLHINGTGEPKAGITVFIETGLMLTTDVDENGVWEVTHQLDIEWNEPVNAEVRITSKEGIQYETETITIPSSIGWSEPDWEPLVVNVLTYKYTTDSTPKPYLYFEGTADPLSTINIELSRDGDTIYLTTLVDEYGSWSAKTLPNFYIMNTGNLGKIKGIAENGVTYAILTFEIPVTPTTPPPRPPSGGGTIEDVIIESIEYLQETTIPFLTYLTIRGTGEPGSKLKFYFPPSSGDINVVIRETYIKEDGTWEIETSRPYYQTIDNLQGTYEAYLVDGSLYKATSFRIPKTPDELIPTPDPTYKDLTIEEITYKYINEQPHFYIRGKGEPNYRVKGFIPGCCDTEETLFDIIINPSGEWEFMTEGVFYQLEENVYGKVQMVNETNEIKDEQQFQIPTTPITEDSLEEILTIDKIEYLQIVYPFPVEMPNNMNLLHIKGRGIAGGRIIIKIPELPYNGNYIEKEINIDTKGNWEYVSEKPYLNVFENIKGEIIGFDVQNKEYKRFFFDIPTIPEVL